MRFHPPRRDMAAHLDGRLLPQQVLRAGRSTRPPGARRISAAGARRAHDLRRGLADLKASHVGDRRQLRPARRGPAGHIDRGAAARAGGAGPGELVRQYGQG